MILYFILLIKEKNLTINNINYIHTERRGSGRGWRDFGDFLKNSLEKDY